MSEVSLYSSLRCLQRGGRYDQAEEGYSAALALDPRHAVALCNKVHSKPRTLHPEPLTLNPNPNPKP